ncbi:MAG: tetratricopeptide repeat protein [Geobacteraceae bacterium]|nr:tetratricopeptide repeat protein [Geobacteraceae bacterium]
MSKGSRWIFLTLFLTIFSTSLANGAASSPKESAQWWVSRYGVISSKEDSYVLRADAVFKRVSAAADKAAGRLPRLLVIRADNDPWAVAIPDGTIILSKGGLDACYRGTTPEGGDDRLAFIVGHELAHLAKDDFWHSRVAKAVREFSGSGKNVERLATLIRNTSDRGASKQANDEARVKELQADGYGIVYMAMAGYNPQSIAGKESNSFIHDFSSQATGQIAYDDPKHPAPSQRVEFLRVTLAEVAQEVELFRIGSLYFQLGRYEEAIPFFERFRERFPSRETFNNLGLSYYQLALDHLAQCDSVLPYRYKLPVLFDNNTLAIVPRGSSDLGQASACYRDDTYQKYLDGAILNLEQSKARDPEYLPSRLNLASAYVMKGNYTLAMATADEALRLRTGDADAASIKAVALYLFGRSSALDSTDAALEILRPFASSNVQHPSALYNMAAIEHDRGRHVEMKTHLESFITQEKSGAYHAQALKLLGRTSQEMPVSRRQLAPKSPVQLGELRRESITMLATMRLNEFVLGTVRVKFYSGSRISLLLRDGLVDLITMKQDGVKSQELFQLQYGNPRRVILTLGGKILVYDNFTALVENNLITSITFGA